MSDRAARFDIVLSLGRRSLFYRTIALVSSPRPEKRRFAPLVILSLGAIALTAALVLTQAADSVEAREKSGAECKIVKVELDEGYSISRVEERRVCG